MQSLLFNYPNLEVRAGSVFDLLFDDSDLGNPWGKVVGVKLGAGPFQSKKSNEPTGLIFAETQDILHCSQVVICTGTFLSGEIHMGNSSLAATLHNETHNILFRNEALPRW
jgi:tRNA uridine 5-carboxymethylaminomethyl modification enzyme